MDAKHLDREDWALLFKKARYEFERLSLTEEKLDERIARARQWSDRWWDLLQQISIVRGQRIYVDRMIGEIGEILKETSIPPDTGRVPAARPAPALLRNKPEEVKPLMVTPTGKLERRK